MRERARLPAWLKKGWPADVGVYRQTSAVISELGLNTICESGACPNRVECYAASHTTILLMGSKCTRRCPFCDVPFAPAGELDPLEPVKTAWALRRLGMKYVVLTSVTRDDLADGGSAHIAATVRRVREEVPGIRIEVLIPDFAGRMESVDEVLAAVPDVLSHNMETIPRLYRAVRPGASFEASLDILARARAAGAHPMVKSSLMLGLGEEEEEVLSVFDELASHGCEALCLGQYLQPPTSRLRVKEYLAPERFFYYRARAEERGIPWVEAGPFVRTSYRAASLLEKRNAR
ncbi:MAG: lipoyl synthase [Candidatus Omnitrophica bacterium]|nr:lipoyl synthase [Candidatus Omnitrophota bacterium]